MVARLPPGEPIQGLIIVPTAVQDSAAAGAWIADAMISTAGFPAIGRMVTDIGFVRALGYSVGRPRGAVPVRLVAVMTSERSAILVSGGLGLIKGLAGVLPSEGASAEQRLAIAEMQQLSVERDGDLLSFSLALGAGALR
jgi:hypothetical protein